MGSDMAGVPKLKLVPTGSLALAEGGFTAALDIGPLAQLTGYVLRRAQMAVFDDFIATLAELRLRPAQYSVLMLLERHPGSTQSAVAAALGIQRANFVALLDTLQSRGLTRRTPSPQDKRSHALYLTGLGTRTLQRAHALVAAHEARQVARLGGDAAALQAALRRLSEPA
jgi:DNA-binding MarR family transcriptional regulator